MTLTGDRPGVEEKPPSPPRGLAPFTDVGDATGSAATPAKVPAHNDPGGRCQAPVGPRRLGSFPIFLVCLGCVVPADQAIFTSMERRGRAGYHLVSRSPGVGDAEAAALERWCPSHGGLLSDDGNLVSVNFFPLNGGRFVVSRTRLGLPEFSGRGGRQVYTRAVLFDGDTLKRSGLRPFLIYRDALALGHLHYHPDPPPVLPRVELSTYWQVGCRDAGTTWARDQGMPVFDSVLTQLNAGQAVVITHQGNRAALVESILKGLEPDALTRISFATSLRPSNVRPFQLHVVAPGDAGN